MKRAFGVLQRKFHIIATPCRLGRKPTMDEIMYFCVILHRMVVGSERPLAENIEKDGR